MALEQCLFTFRLLVYCCLGALSFICWIPLCIVMDFHQGYCLLYADSTEYGPLAPCGYTITVPIIFSLLYAAYMAVSYFYKITFYNKYGYVEETMLEFILTVTMDGVAWIFMFVNASLLSAGFNKMCWNVFGTITRCSEGQLKQPVFGTDNTFYGNLKMAEVASWISWLLWLLQLTMGIMALRRSGILPQTSIYSAMCQVLPCQPRCTCSFRLHFNRPERQTPEAPSPQKVVTKV